MFIGIMTEQKYLDLLGFSNDEVWVTLGLRPQGGECYATIIVCGQGSLGPP